MNLRTRFKRLKQFVERTKADYREVYIDRTQLEHFRCKAYVPLFYGRDDLATDEQALRVAKDKLKGEFSKLVDRYIEILPDESIALDVWLKPESSLIKDGITIVGGDRKMNRIEIYRGSTGSDCTGLYIITTPFGMTVREFITEWMEDKREWGYFGINDGKSIFGNPCCEYRDGKIISEPLPNDILDSVILKTEGRGGWSRSDFIFTIGGENERIE